MPAFSRFTALAQSLPPTVPFVGPETQERARGAEFKARLGANENGFGAAPSVIEAIAREAELSWRYADPENHDLRIALGAHLGLSPERVVVGEGIDGLLGLIVRLIVEPGTAVVTSLGAYPTFNFHVAGFGGRLVTVPYRDDREDLDALLDAVRRENASLVYLSNPDNPMGTWHSAEAVTAFAKALPETTMLVLDEAYGEAAPASALPAIAHSGRYAQRAALPHFLESLRPGRSACRLRLRRGRDGVDVPPGEKPFRRQPAGPGSGPCRAQRPGLACPCDCPGGSVARPDCSYCSGSRLCPDPVGHQFRHHRLRPRCGLRQGNPRRLLSAAASSSACPASHRSTAASAYPPDLQRRSTCSRAELAGIVADLG
jgi:hypothetical protein